MLPKQERSAATVKEFYEGFHSRICLQESPKFNRWLLKILKMPPQIKLLDIACGGGYFLSAASQKEIDCYGADISEQALKIASNQPGKKELVVADAQALPFKSDYFDLVSCLGSLEHFVDPAAAIQEMLRVARTTARFCILLPNQFSWENIELVKKTGQTPSHGQELERFATRGVWEQFLADSGLVITKVYNYNGFPRLFEVKNGRLTIKSLRKFFRRFFIPFNLCSSFIFICHRVDHV